MAQRDATAAGVLTAAVAAFLFTWSPALHPGSAPPRPAPPAIAYFPAALTAGDLQENYDEWNAAHSPALIALSAAMMLPPDESGQAEAVTPPLDAAYSRLRFPDTLPVERHDLLPVLTPSHRMTTPAPRHPASTAPDRSPAPAPPARRVDLIGDWQGRSVDLAPVSALNEPAGPWSFTAVLRYDQDGQVQHAILEAAALDRPLRDEIARRLYQCRVTPGGASGEGRLTVSGPGRQ